MRLAAALGRRKTEDEEALSTAEGGPPRLKRVLGLGDLTMLGVGSTLGLGVYVLAGAVARSDAGPAVTLSFLIAAVASAFAGFCYAEFAARVPKAGSAYVYSYVTVGELTAFIIGWNLILEYVIGTASVARGLSNYIDSLSNKAMSSALTEVLPIGVSWLSPYPDFLSCGFVLILSLLLAWGVKESSFLNNVFTAVNLFTIVFVCAVGVFYIDFKNWALPAEGAPSQDPSGEAVNAGSGGFMPFGFSGVMAGAAKCFFGFVGFDCIATTGEEAKNPKRDIPLSIVISLTIIFIAYFCIAGVLTLMWPYYLQDPDAPLPFVFGQIGLPLVKWVVTFGAIFALLTSMLGSLFPIPRMLYAMSSDGLLYTPLAAVDAARQTPAKATLTGGTITGVMAAVFNLEQLIDMMSIGTLLAYSVVGFCVLLLRYSSHHSVKCNGSAETCRLVRRLSDVEEHFKAQYQDPHPVMFEPGLDKPDIQTTPLRTARDVFNLSGMKHPSPTTQAVANFSIAVYIASTAVFCVTLVNVEDQVAEGSVVAIAAVTLLLAVMLISMLVLARQPQSQAELAFKVPWLPLIPCVSLAINFYLMVKLDIHTWIRFSVWLFVGMMIYIFYSIPHSVEGIKQRQLKHITKPSTNTATTRI